MDKISSIWFFAEWLTILGTILGGYYMIDSKFERHAQRTDKLYEIWVETQKEIKQMYKDNQNKG